jgi:hypothetical protein
MATQVGYEMSGTKRTPLDRPVVGFRITEHAIDIFTAMGRLRCTCLQVIPERYWLHKMCASCEKWYSLHGRLADELGASVEPWEWPIVSRQSPRRAGSTCCNEGMAARTAAFKAAAKARRATKPTAPPPLEEGKPDAGDAGQNMDTIT